MDGEKPIVVPAEGGGDVPILISVDPHDLFTSRATVITSNALTIWAFTLNWWAHIHGLPEYCPEWVIGFIWAPWGVKVWIWIKEHLARSGKGK